MMINFPIPKYNIRVPKLRLPWYIPFVLIGLTSAYFHLISLMSLPLQPHPDSIPHLEGAVTFAKSFSLEGVGSARMPGLALIYGSFFWLFGAHAAWPLQFFLHLIAWCSVLLVYGICWELTQKHLFAFFCGMLAAIWPEFIYFSNVLLTEMPSGFFCLLALYSALHFMRSRRIIYLYITLLSASYAVLIRSEYLLNLLCISFFILTWLLWEKSQTSSFSSQFIKIKHHLVMAIFLALIPLVAWSCRNYQSYNYFGLTSYSGDVLYDGFVIAGKLFGIPVLDEGSPAIKSLKEAYEKDKRVTIEKGQPWPEGREFGVNAYNDGTSLSKFSNGPWEKTVSPIFKRAALDSIKAHPYESLCLITKKILVGLKDPYWTLGWLPNTGPMPGESDRSFSGWVETYSHIFQAKPGVGDYLTFQYRPSVDFIKKQREINSIYISHTRSIYFSGWRYLALIGFILCLFCRPFLSWTLFLVVTFNMVLLPFILCYPLGRFAVPGGFLLMVLFSSVLWQIVHYLGRNFSRLFSALSTT
ncbi:MAG: phospholipid carrier-dependent glycosyltransferase [Desulfobacula sp.]|nr:phospholipid carrier-dependent glycosyltransferase [Desulfobacula sp.]